MISFITFWHLTFSRQVCLKALKAVAYALYKNMCKLQGKLILIAASMCYNIPYVWFMSFSVQKLNIQKIHDVRYGYIMTEKCYLRKHFSQTVIAVIYLQKQLSNFKLCRHFECEKCSGAVCHFCYYSGKWWILIQPNWLVESVRYFIQQYFYNFPKRNS